MNIAITGGIGAGKSTMMTQLQVAFPTARFWSMDKLVDELYQEPEWNKWLKERFGTIDRKEISNRAFACDSVRAILNSQSALKIGVKLGKILTRDGINFGINFIEFPLLFESGIQNEFDQVVLITASTEVRVQRVVARGKKTAEEALAVINAQMPEAAKMKLANIVVDTTGGDIQASTTPLIHAIKEYLGNVK